MKDYNYDYHKLTNSLLTPLEAQRLAMNLQMIEQARKSQAHTPIWLMKLSLSIVFLYILLGILTLAELINPEDVLSFLNDIFEVMKL